MSLKAISAKPESLNIFFDNYKNYVVPDYQRPYSWTDDECSQLWNDLVTFYDFCNSKEYDNSPYFLGNMVYHKNTSSEIYHIVDGQQRLTTITILLKILHEKHVLYAPLYKLIWKTDTDLDNNVTRKAPLELNIKSAVNGANEQKYFEEIINSMPKKDKNEPESIHKNNYFILKEKIEEWYSNNINDFKNFVDTIINKVVFLPILCEDEEHALTIFETINNRGKSLSDADIFKSHLYKVALKDNTTNDFIKRWDDIYDKNVLELSRIYSHIIRGEKKDKDIEIGLRKFFTIDPLKDRAGFVLSKQDNWEKIMDDFDRLASCKEYLLEYSNNNIKKWWNTLTLVLNTYVPYLLYVYLFYNLSSSNDSDILHLTKDKSKEFEKLSLACVKYFYGKRLCNFTQVDMKYFVFDLIIKLSNNRTSVDDIIEIMRLNLQPEQKTIEDKINNEDFGRIKTALVHILAYHYDNQEYISNVQIEHILPKKWVNFKYAKWDWNEENVKDNIERIGNLVLIESKLNKRANNHILYQKQKEAYAESEFKAFETLTTLTKWSPDTLDERTRDCKSVLKDFFRKF